MASAWRVGLSLLVLANGPGRSVGVPATVPLAAAPPVANSPLRSGTDPSVAAVVPEVPKRSAEAAAPAEAVRLPESPAPESTNSSTGAVPQAAPAHYEWHDSHWQWHIARPAFTLLGFIKTLCMISNVVFQISPLPEAMSWETRENTGDTEPAPLVGIWFCGWQWCFYGIFAWYETGVSGFLVLVEANLSGGVLGTYYLWTFYRNCKRERELNNLKGYVGFAACLVFAQSFSLLACKIRSALFFAGFVASGCAILCSASILMPIPECIQTRSSAAISTPVVLAMAGSGTLWLICGYMLDDPHIAVPQCVALCSCALCLWLKMTYPDEGCDKARSGVLAIPEGQIDDPSRQSLENQSARSALPAMNESTHLVIATNPSASTGGTPSTYGETGGTF